MEHMVRQVLLWFLYKNKEMKKEKETVQGT